jgi:hypothetical protein
VLYIKYDGKTHCRLIPVFPLKGGKGGGKKVAKYVNEAKAISGPRFEAGTLQIA